MKIELSALLPYVAAILAAGLWLGTLQHRVEVLERKQFYSHGDVTPFLKQE